MYVRIMITCVLYGHLYYACALICNICMYVCTYVRMYVCTYFHKHSCVLLRIGYQYLMEASYDDNRFKIKYRMYTLREPTDYEVVFKTTRSKAAHLIFRTLTEDHTYFTQATVCDRVLNHFECETFYKVLKASVLNRPLEKKYHFDVVRYVCVCIHVCTVCVHVVHVHIHI